jgi:hypothetical protein
LTPVVERHPTSRFQSLNLGLTWVLSAPCGAHVQCGCESHPAPVEEDAGGQGGVKEQGTPQGAPCSPLLANLYIRRLILARKKLGYEQRFSGVVETGHS